MPDWFCGGIVTCKGEGYACQRVCGNRAICSSKALQFSEEFTSSKYGTAHCVVTDKQTTLPHVLSNKDGSIVGGCLVLVEGVTSLCLVKPTEN